MKFYTGGHYTDNTRRAFSGHKNQQAITAYWMLMTANCDADKIAAVDALQFWMLRAKKKGDELSFRKGFAMEFERSREPGKPLDAFRYHIAARLAYWQSPISSSDEKQGLFCKLPMPTIGEMEKFLRAKGINAGTHSKKYIGRIYRELGFTPPRGKAGRPRKK